MEYTGERLIIGNKECDENSDIYKEHIERYKFALKFIQKNNKVLDTACGDGYGTKLLAETEADEVWGADINQQAIETAKNKYSAENLHFRIVDGVDMPFEDNYFDVVISFETIEHIKDYQSFIKEIKRVLKPSGKLIISTPDRKITKKLGIDNPFHVREFTKKEMADLMQTHFKQVEFYGQRPVKRLSLKQKLLQKAYLIYRKLGFLGFLGRIVSNKSKHRVDEEIKGLEKDFEVRQIEKGKEYLYLVIIAEKKS